MKKLRLRPDVVTTLRSLIREHVSMALICLAFFVAYRRIAGTALMLAILAFVLLYVGAITGCHFGMAKFLQHEKNNTVTQKRLVGYSFLIGLPIYYLWLLFSLIPIAHYSVWMLSGLPLVITTGFTLFSIADRWRENKALFWSAQLVLYLCLLFGGQWAIHSLF